MHLQSISRVPEVSLGQAGKMRKAVRTEKTGKSGSGLFAADSQVRPVIIKLRIHAVVIVDNFFTFDTADDAERNALA